MKTPVHVSLILDKSNSMGSVLDTTISGFNEYLSTLKNDKKIDYTFDLTLFDTEVSKRYVGVPLSKVEKLSRENYVPMGNTALYDAVCETLLGRKAEVGGKWIVAVLTDGEENASRKYDEQKMADMIKLLTNTGNVTFVYLGSNQDAWQKAQNWNFHKENVATYSGGGGGSRAAFMAMAVNTSATANAQDLSTRNFFSSTDKEKLEHADDDNTKI